MRSVRGLKPWLCDNRMCSTNITALQAACRPALLGTCGHFVLGIRPGKDYVTYYKVLGPMIADFPFRRGRGANGASSALLAKGLLR